MTAETAVVLPLLVVFTLGLVWLVSLGVTHVRVVDAARETARAVARGESTGAGAVLGRRVAPQGSTIRVRTGSGTVVATVRTRVRGPAGLFGFLPPVEVGAQAVAAQEPGAESGSGSAR